jgi:hypothetical protein
MILGHFTTGLVLAMRIYSQRVLDVGMEEVFDEYLFLLVPTE